MKDKTLREKIDPFIYYLIIGATTFITLIVMPLIGSDFDAAMSYPSTTAGWIVFVITKLIVAMINVLLFFSFMQQGKLNILKDAAYLQAKNIMDNLSTKIERSKKYIPKAPEKWLKIQYSKKGTLIFVSSLLGAFALTQAILQYDYATLISYALTIFFGLMFGIIQMKKVEFYWTSEYLDYAKLMEKKINEREMMNNGITV